MCRIHSSTIHNLHEVSEDVVFKQLGLIIFGVATLSLALAAFFSPHFWRGGELPSLSNRISALVTLSMVSACCLIGVLVLSCFPPSHKKTFGMEKLV